MPCGIGLLYSGHDALRNPQKVRPLVVPESAARKYEFAQASPSGIVPLVALSSVVRSLAEVLRGLATLLRKLTTLLCRLTTLLCRLTTLLSTLTTLLCRLTTLLRGLTTLLYVALACHDFRHMLYLA